MKRISVALVVGILFFIIGLNAKAQTNANPLPGKIEPYHLEITFSKTSNIIFPYAIVSADIGSKDIIAQKANGAENILQLKATKENFPQTNISVVTSDGRFTSFLVDYAAQPSVLNLSFVPEEQRPGILNSENINSERLKYYSSLAAKPKAKMRGIKDEAFGIGLKLNGIFIHDEIMLLRFNISNETNISYDIDQFRLFIRDQKKVKRTATQEIEMPPLFVYNNTNKISGHSENTIVFVVKKFTIPDKKYLVVQLMEKNGGRHLKLHVKNRKIIRAALID